MSSNRELCNPVSLGIRLQSMRLRKGLLQQDLVGPDKFPARCHVSRIENGRHSITMDSLERYCTAIGCHISEVFNA